MDINNTSEAPDPRTIQEALAADLDLPKVSVDIVRPHIDGFARSLTAEQWGLLAAGKPDNDTRLRLADMLVKVLCNLVDIMSQFFKQDATAERVRDSLDDSIARSFADALGVESVKGPASDHLTDLIVTEVLGSSSQPKPNNAMIRSVCKMLKKCANRICTCYKVKQSRRGGVIQSSDAEVSSTTQSVQEIINDEVTQIIQPIVEDITDSEYHQLQEEFSVDIQCAAEDIAQSVFEYKDVPVVYPTTKSQQQSQKGLKTKICNFFAKMFAKASIFRVFSQVKAKYNTETKASDNDSVKSLLDDAEYVLNTSGKIQMSEDEVCMLKRLEKISKEDILELTGELSDLLYSHITGETAPESFREGSSGTATASEAQAHANIYDDIRRRVVCFLSLMSWWLENQVRSYSERVVQTLMKTEPILMQMQLGPGGEEPDVQPDDVVVDQGDIVETEVSRTCLRLVITTLIKRVWKSVKGDRAFFTDLKSTIQRLVDNTWAQLDYDNINITPGNVQNLDKAIFRHLSKRWGSAMRVLVSMEGGDPDLPKCIAAFCKTYLLKNRSAILRFFSA